MNQYMRASKTRGPKKHIHMRTLDSGSKMQDKRDSRNHGLQDPYLFLAFGDPVSISGAARDSTPHMSERSGHALDGELPQLLGLRQSCW